MKKLASIILLLSLTGCHFKAIIDRGDYQVMLNNNAIGQDDRIRFLVFHYTTLNDELSIRGLSRNKGTTHYLVLTKPKKLLGKPIVLQLIPEKRRAWHAGRSNWRGRNNINDTSIGIEIVNLGFTHIDFSTSLAAPSTATDTCANIPHKKWHPYNEQQITLVARLAKDIIRRYNIEATNIIGHSDIAPLRKIDPGPLFPWACLAQLGIGAWPDSATIEKYRADREPKAAGAVNVIQHALAKYGYEIPQTGKWDAETKAVISAFQMHFRPTDFSGVADVETEAIALALIEKYKL